MKLSLGISPCPNDTYIFDAMLHGKIDTEGLEFIPRLEDVETLNHLAIEGSLDITKVSYGAVFQLISQYRILEAGSALGKGVGPLLDQKTLTMTGKLISRKYVLPFLASIQPLICCSPLLIRR